VDGLADGEEGQGWTVMGALETLLALKGGSNMNSTGDAYLDKRRSAIHTGEADYEPSEMELMDAQNVSAPGSPYGVSLSRDRVRDSAMQTMRRTLRLDDREHGQTMERVTAPEHIRGQYDVSAAQSQAEAAINKLLLGQQQQSMLQEDRQAHQTAQTQAQIDAALARQNDAQGFKQDTAKAPGLTQIASRRQMLMKAASDPKNEPGVLGGLFGKTNQYKDQLAAFDNTLAAAQGYAQKYPTQSVEEILALEGEDGLTPEEHAQLSEFMLLLRGR
jgi:hypothetical protein